ncbi:MAG: hypothetical protein IJH18_03585 [Bacilli bacterium]|nr:hypothetical protein [Bacilli bacterium]
MKRLKRDLLFLFIAVLIGAFVGDFVSTHYGKKIPVISHSNSFYIMQEGVYNSEEQLRENVKSLSPKAVINKDDKYYVYVGITKDEKVLEKLFNIYKDKGYTIYTKEEDFNNAEFARINSQFDEMIKKTNDPEEILKMEELVLASYQQKLKN